MACVSQGCTSDLGGGLPHFFLCYIPLYPATYSEVNWDGGLQSSVGYCSGGFFNISHVLINQPRIHSCAHACMACLSQGSKSNLGGGGYKHDKCGSQESQFFNLSQVLINQPRMTHKTCELTCK